MSKVRVSTLAKELGIPSKEAVAWLNANGEYSSLGGQEPPCRGSSNQQVSSFCAGGVLIAERQAILPAPIRERAV